MKINVAAIKVMVVCNNPINDNKLPMENCEDYAYL